MPSHWWDLRSVFNHHETHAVTPPPLPVLLLVGEGLKWGARRPAFSDTYAENAGSV